MARALGEEGAAALDRRDWATALDRFSKADKLFHAPTLAYGHARALAGTGKLVAALEAFNRLAREPVSATAPAAFRDAIASAKRDAEALEPRIPTLVIELVGATQATVTIDGETVPSAALGLPRPVDPGDHVVRAEAPGFATTTEKVTSREREGKSVKLTMTRIATAPVTSTTAPPPPPTAPATSTAAPAPGPRASNTPAYVALGVGAVGVAVGVVGSVLFIGKKSSLDSACTDGKCPATAQSDHDAYKTYGLVSTIGLGVGVVGLGAGAALLLLSPAPTDSARIVPVVGPGTAGIRGSF